MARRWSPIVVGAMMALSLDAQTPTTVTRSGCMVYRDGRFILQDRDTQEIVELNGADLAANVGNRVEASGTLSGAKPAVSIATSVLNVTSIAPKALGGCLTVSVALGARADVPAPSTPANNQKGTNARKSK